MPKRTRKARLEIFVHHTFDDCFDVRWMWIARDVVDCALVDDIVRGMAGLHEELSDVQNSCHSTHLHDIQRPSHVSLAQLQ